MICTYFTGRGQTPVNRCGWQDMASVSGGVTYNANDVVSLVRGFALFCAGLPWQSRLPVCIFLYIFQSFHNLLQPRLRFQFPYVFCQLVFIWRYCWLAAFRLHLFHYNVFRSGASYCHAPGMSAAYGAFNDWSVRATVPCVMVKQ